MLSWWKPAHPWSKSSVMWVWNTMWFSIGLVHEGVIMFVGWVHFMGKACKSKKFCDVNTCLVCEDGVPSKNRKLRTVSTWTAEAVSALVAFFMLILWSGFRVLFKLIFLFLLRHGDLCLMTNVCKYCVCVFLIYFEYVMYVPRAHLRNATQRSYYYYYYSQSVLTVTMAENGSDGGMRQGQHRLLVVLTSHDLSRGKQTWW